MTVVPSDPLWTGPLLPEDPDWPTPGLWFPEELAWPIWVYGWTDPLEADPEWYRDQDELRPRLLIYTPKPEGGTEGDEDPNKATCWDAWWSKCRSIYAFADATTNEDIEWLTKPARSA